MSRLALMAALFGATYAPPTHVIEMQPQQKAVMSSRRKTSVFKRHSNSRDNCGSGNKKLPGHLQKLLIDAAKDRRARRSDKLVWDGLTRDSRYYRVKFGSNKNRFKHISSLN